MDSLIAKCTLAEAILAELLEKQSNMSRLQKVGNVC